MTENRTLPWNLRDIRTIMDMPAREWSERKIPVRLRLVAVGARIGTVAMLLMLVVLTLKTLALGITFLESLRPSLAAEEQVGPRQIPDFRTVEAHRIAERATAYPLAGTRSGLDDIEFITDRLSGCQYLATRYGITPRLNESGAPSCMPELKTSPPTSGDTRRLEP